MIDLAPFLGGPVKFVCRVTIMVPRAVVDLGLDAPGVAPVAMLHSTMR